MEVGSNILQVVVALLATLGILIVCAFVAKRLLSGSRGSNGLIKVLATRTLGSRERLMLVELQGQTVLIGVTQHTISKLHVLDGEMILDSESTATFSDTLSSWMGNK